MSKLTDEFIIYGIESENGYYYISHHKKEIMKVISRVYSIIEQTNFKFLLTNEKSEKYTLISSFQNTLLNYKNRIENIKKIYCNNKNGKMINLKIYFGCDSFLMQMNDI